MSKFVPPTYNHPHRQPASPLLLFGTVAVALTTALLLGGCSGGGGKTTAPAATSNSDANGTGAAVATGRVVVSLQWPALTSADTAAAAASRRISSAVRRVELYVTNGTGVPYGPSSNPTLTLFQQTISRTQDSGAKQTVVFPAVPLRDNINLQAIAYDENGRVIATAISLIDKNKPGTTQQVNLSLASTATALSVATAPDYDPFTQTLPLSDKGAIPVGESRTFTITATDSTGQVVFLAPDDLDFSTPLGFSVASLGGSQFRVTANASATSLLPGTVRFSLKPADSKASITVTNDVPVTATPKITVSNVKVGATTTQGQEVTFNYSSVLAGNVTFAVQYVPDFDPANLFGDYSNRPVVSQTVFTPNADGTGGTFKVDGPTVNVSTGGSAPVPMDAGIQTKPVLYQVIILSQDGTGRAVIPIIVNDVSRFVVAGPAVVYKNTPSAVFTAAAPEGVTFSLTGPSADAFTLVPDNTPNHQSVTLTPNKVPLSGDYVVTATRGSGAVQTTTFNVPDVTVVVSDTAGAVGQPVGQPYTLKSIKQDFSARVIGLDPKVNGKGVTWSVNSGTLTNLLPFAVTYQLPPSPTGYVPGTIYVLTAASNDDLATVGTLNLQINSGTLKATIQ